MKIIENTEIRNINNKLIPDIKIIINQIHNMIKDWL